MSEPWNQPEREVTPEKAVLSRRRWLKRAGAGALGLGAGGAAGWWWWFRGGSDTAVLDSGHVEAPAGGLYPAQRNPLFAEADRPETREVEAARYTNFYEFSSYKEVWRHVQSFHPLPWTLEVSGLVAKPRTYDLDDLVRSFPLEERVYRHRCVEAWAMVVPWTGFPLAALLARAEPLPSARYVRFVSFHRPQEAAGQKATGFPWPYTEGLTLDEATHELTFVATGMYGHPLLKQHGAPVRVVVPWKYGFKGTKSVVRVELTGQQPETFWPTVAPAMYTFASNVDPGDRRQGWSQGYERMLGTNELRPTLPYNGYGEWVTRLYPA
jgi:sulfoxide reductase catalytic subunit YedY